MTTQIGYFRFEVQPWTYATDYFPGSATVLRVTVIYNERKYDIQEIMPAIRPWESELEHYGRLAIEALKQALQQEGTK